MWGMTSSGIVLQEVLDSLSIQYEFVDAEKVLFKIALPNDRYHYIINNILGLNSESDVKLCADKAYTYQLLSDVVKMPKTFSFLDPNGPYGEFSHFDLAGIFSTVKEKFEYPVVIKKNAGSLGSHVFVCKDQLEVKDAVTKIFNRQSSAYDYVVLAQEAIRIKSEWRVLMLHGKLEFMYRKDTSEATFTGNLSPLHWEGGKAVLETDFALQEEIAAFLSPLFSKWQLPYGGFDVVRDEVGELWLIEINSHPAFAHFLADCESTPLKQMYTKIVKELVHV